jgi:ubiquinone/menaquinone biosynthesis C-methylase UbiE
MNAAQQKLLKRVTTYKYFIAYAYENRHGMIGNGMIEMTMALPIRGTDDIKCAVKEIRRISKIKGEIVLLNWILL